MAENTLVTNHAIINCFLAWWPHGTDFQVRNIRPSWLDEWLALQEPRLRNVSYNRYAGFLKQLFDIAVKDRIIAESPAKALRVPWKTPQTPKRIIQPWRSSRPSCRTSARCRLTSPQSRHTEDTADFLEFLGLAGLGQAEASALKWGNIDWQRNRVNVRRQKTDTHFYLPIYAHLRPLLLRLKAARRGRVLSTALVFKIKDAKKALAAACKRLNLPPFSQRSLRQGLIMRLWKSGVDKELIARWQGHKDGGQLIMDTYTEVFGDDDEAYEQIQLEKIGGGSVPVAQFSGDDSADAPSGSMKKRMRKARPKKSVPPAANVPTADSISPVPVPAVESPGLAESIPAPEVPSAPATAVAPVPAPAGNPYKKGDRVKTQCKGEEVEAEVTAVYKDEVQVKTPDGERRWRTVRTVQ